MIFHLRASHWGALFVSAYANRVSANSLISIYKHLYQTKKGYQLLHCNTIIEYPDLIICQHLTNDTVYAHMMNLFR